jgi:4-hydroxybenzoate polyprenyltransferase
VSLRRQTGGRTLRSSPLLRRRRSRNEDEKALLLIVLAATSSGDPEDGTRAGNIDEDGARNAEISSSAHHENDHYPFDGTLSPPAANAPHHPTVWKDRAALFEMTRPSSIPGIVLFHMLGVFLVLRGTTATGSSTAVHFWSLLLKQPTLWLTLLATNLVSATSMVVNDYYDAKLGRDTLKINAESKKALLNKSVSRPTVKRFLMYLYAAALIVSTFLPGVPTRLSVVTALIMTYLHTKHLKPMTWIKNIVCASLIALAPWTSGSCAWNLVHPSYYPVAAESTSIGHGLRFIFLVPELWRAFVVLFAGVLGREILMDCNDKVADEAAGIRTVPVVYGRRVGVQVAAVSTVVMALTAMAPHVRPLVKLPAAVPFWTCPPLRRLVLAGVASGAHLWGVWKVWKTQAEDEALVTKTVDNSLLTVVGILASFV